MFYMWSAAAPERKSMIFRGDYQREEPDERDAAPGHVVEQGLRRSVGNAETAPHQDDRSDPWRDRGLVG